MRLFVLLLAGLAASLSQQTFAAEPLSVMLEAHKVILAAGGKERLVTAADARPGDVLQYRATYTNVSKKPLRAVMATLPVPASGVEYLLDSATPSGAEASINGAQFAPAPLQRQVKLPDGKQEQRPIPAAEYRFLRWPLGDLPAGASKTVSARVRIVNEPTLTPPSK